MGCIGFEPMTSAVWRQRSKPTGLTSPESGGKSTIFIYSSIHFCIFFYKKLDNRKIRQYLRQKNGFIPSNSLQLEKKVYLCSLTKSTDMKKRKYIHLISFLACILLFCFAMPSCTTTQHGTKKAPRYTRQKTKSPRWNASTSRTTTYYIKKHYRRNSPKTTKKRNK